MSLFAPRETRKFFSPDEPTGEAAPDQPKEELTEEEIAKRKAERKAKRAAERAAKKAAEAGEATVAVAEPASDEPSEEEIEKRKAERKAARAVERAAKKAAEAGDEATPAEAVATPETADAEPSEEEIAKRKAERKAAREAERAAKKAAEAAPAADAPATEELTDEEREKRKAERKAAREAERAAKKAAETGGDAPAQEKESDEEREKRRAERKAAREAAKAEGGEEKPAREKKDRPAKDDGEKKDAKKKSSLAIPSRKFVLSASPHIHDKASVKRIMWTVTATLIPATIGATWVFGFRALILVCLGCIAAMLTEWGLQKLFKMKSTVADGSALLTGMLVSFNLPPGVPWWIPMIGAFFAIAVAKMPFGGLGWNPMNPALIGRAFLLASWPLHMTKDWLPAFWWRKEGFNFFTWNVNPAAIKVDGVSYATPLEVRKKAIDTVANQEGLPNDIIARAMDALHSTGDQIVDLITGVTGGSIGETSAILLLLGAAYLLYKGIIDWRTPFAFIATVGIGGWLFGGVDGLFSGDMMFHIFAGGLILGAFYMATDMVTTPITKVGRLYFGLGAGLLTLMIRLIGGYPEGVSYAILLMNLTTPLIDRYTKPRRFGHVKSDANAKTAGGVRQ
jgi:H+/Na+-translocating ferredoxin:NAD+ oxidoreductase subunit D